MYILYIINFTFRSRFTGPNEVVADIDTLYFFGVYFEIIHGILFTGRARSVHAIRAIVVVTFSHSLRPSRDTTDLAAPTGGDFLI